MLKNFIGRVETAVTNVRFHQVGLDALTAVVHRRLQQHTEHFLGETANRTIEDVRLRPRSGAAL